MLPIRTPLGERSGNARDGKHLSPYQRGQVVGQYYKGAKPATIATALKYMELCSNGEDLPRAARKLSYSDRDEHIIIYYIRLFPKYTYKQVKNIYRVKNSTTTIKRLLKKYGITN
ncbi:hypothetical protein CJF32_00005386 [Rutstroemia sp. NJR-2017a WRK4]|nr:hypothetical protein CJF32_00005386 [Rutstroemia sp. NJR-2017a WRK4]